jgi:hypothetical protein
VAKLWRSVCGLIFCSRPALLVCPQRRDGLATDRHDSLLGALAARAQHPFVEIDVACLQPDRLRGTQTARVHDLQQGAVAKHGGLGPLRLAQQLRNLLAREHSWQALRPGGPAELGGGIVLDQALAPQMAVERA